MVRRRAGSAHHRPGHELAFRHVRPARRLRAVSRSTGSIATYATDKALFTMLSGQFVAGNSRSLYRAIDGGKLVGRPGLGPRQPRRPRSGRHRQCRRPADRAPGDDRRRLALRGAVRGAAGGWRFRGRTAELDKFWQRPATKFTAAYSIKYAHGGRQSLRTGIDGDADVYSYSSANQYVTIPAGVASATLDFWWYPISAEGPWPRPRPGSPTWRGWRRRSPGTCLTRSWPATGSTC